MLLPFCLFHSFDLVTVLCSEFTWIRVVFSFCMAIIFEVQLGSFLFLKNVFIHPD